MSGGEEGEKPATPWFLYFIVLLLIALVVLIALYCVALNDPNFPSRKHKGPNLVHGGPPITAALLSKPVTGAKAQPHEIPFALHRQPKRPKPSKLVRPTDPSLSETAPVSAPAPAPAPAPAVEGQLTTFTSAPAPSNFQLAAGMIRSIASRGAFAFRGILGKAAQIVVGDTGTGKANPDVGDADEGASHVAGAPPPFVSGMEVGPDGHLRIFGANFHADATISFLTQSSTIHNWGEATCQVLNSKTIECQHDTSLDKKSLDKSILSEIRALVMNPDSQSFNWQDPAHKSYFLSFASPGVPGSASVGKPLPAITVGLYIDGVPERFPAAPVSIWLEILSSGSSSSDVVREIWGSLDGRGLATFDDIVPPSPGTYVLRATAVQTLANHRKIIAPIIESLPIRCT